MTSLTLSPSDLVEAPADDFTLFHHQPLSDCSKEFRLVEFLPGDEDIIRCRLSSYSLSSPPDYYAASYEWGEDDSIEVIEINGGLFGVRPNLWDFLLELRELRLPDTSRGFFIDAICIDQDSVIERNTQVRMMADIYAKATRVEAWLGVASDNSDALIDLCVSDHCEDLERRIEAIMNKVTYQPQFLPSVMQDEYVPFILALFSRSYWNRLWVIQEILLAQNVMIHCGSRFMPWPCLDKLTWVFPELVSKSFHKQGHGFKTSGLFYDRRNRMLSERFMHLVNLRRQGRKSIPFAMLLDIFGEALCEDPHDKVYGFMGLGAEFKNGDNVKVDYSQPIQTLFFEALEYIEPAEQLVFAKRLFDILDLGRQPHLLQAAAELFDARISLTPANRNNCLQIEVLRLGNIRRRRLSLNVDQNFRIYDMKDYKREKKLHKERSVSNPSMSLDSVEFISLNIAQKGDTVYWLQGTKFGLIYRRNPRQARKKTGKLRDSRERTSSHSRFLCGTTVSAVDTKIPRDDVAKAADVLESLDLCNAIVTNDTDFHPNRPSPGLITVRAVDFIRLVQGFTRPVMLRWYRDESMKNMVILYKALTELIGMMWMLSDTHSREKMKALAEGGEIQHTKQVV